MAGPNFDQPRKKPALRLRRIIWSAATATNPIDAISLVWVDFTYPFLHFPVMVHELLHLSLHSSLKFINLHQKSTRNFYVLLDTRPCISSPILPAVALPWFTKVTTPIKAGGGMAGGLLASVDGMLEFTSYGISTAES
jgi:hypothetical protein